MPLYKCLLLFSLSLILSGCFITSLIKDKPLIDRISDTKLILAAAANTISSDYTTGLITQDEARIRLSDVKEARSKIANIESILSVGDVGIAQMKFDAMNQLLFNINKYIARKAQEAET